MTTIFIDADACPVKTEVFRVAKRFELRVVVVANSRMRLPEESWIDLQIVDDRLDAADDWIVERVGGRDIVITGDIPLASRCLKKGARVLGQRGREFTEETIGSDLAIRAILAHIRETWTQTGGPPPFEKRDRSEFLQSLDKIIRNLQKEK